MGKLPAWVKRSATVIGLSIVCAAPIVISKYQVGTDVVQVVSNLVAALLGAFAGAYASTELQRRMQAEDANRAAASVANDVLLGLALRYEFVKTVHVNLLEPIKEKQDREFLLPKMLPPPHWPELRLAEVLSFVRPEDHEVVLKLHRAERNFTLFRESILERNRVVDEIHLDLSKNGIEPEDAVASGAMDRGQAMKHKSLTDHFFKLGESLNQETKVLLNETRRSFQSSLPSQHILYLREIAERPK